MTRPFKFPNEFTDEDQAKAWKRAEEIYWRERRSDMQARIMMALIFHALTIQPESTYIMPSSSGHELHILKAFNARLT